MPSAVEQLFENWQAIAARLGKSDQDYDLKAAVWIEQKLVQTPADHNVTLSILAELDHRSVSLVGLTPGLTLLPAER
jgi:hypothetical protein